MAKGSRWQSDDCQARPTKEKLNQECAGKPGLRTDRQNLHRAKILCGGNYESACGLISNTTGSERSKTPVPSRSSLGRRNQRFFVDYKQVRMFKSLERARPPG